MHLKKLAAIVSIPMNGINIANRHILQTLESSRKEISPKLKPAVFQIMIFLLQVFPVNHFLLLVFLKSKVLGAQLVLKIKLKVHFFLMYAES